MIFKNVKRPRYVHYKDQWLSLLRTVCSNDVCGRNAALCNIKSIGRPTPVSTSIEKLKLQDLLFG
jgi:hypothetical protein